MKHGIIKSLAIALLAGFAVSCSENGENEPQPTYTVTVSAAEGGTAAANKNTCPEGEEVTATGSAVSVTLAPGILNNILPDGTKTGKRLQRRPFIRSSCRRETSCCRHASSKKRQYLPVISTIR